MNGYRLIRKILRPLFNTLFRFEAPAIHFDGPAVVVANHFSLIDPVPLGLAVGPSLDFMAKAEVFRIPILAQFLGACGVFPVVRGSRGRAAIETAIMRAKAGRTIAMFPEGTRSRNGELQPGKMGAAIIALGAGIPILPVAIKGTFEVLPRGKFFPRFFRSVTVKAAPLIDVSPYLAMPDGAERLTEKYMKEIRALLAEG